MLTYLEYAPLLKPSQALKTHFNTSKIDWADIFWGVCFFCWVCGRSQLQPTLRSESRGGLHTMPSREEETPPLWWGKEERAKIFFALFYSHLAIMRFFSLEDYLRHLRCRVMTCYFQSLLLFFVSYNTLTASDV